MADLGDILAAVKAVIDESHTSYVVLEHVQAEALNDLMPAISMCREIVAGMYKMAALESVKLGGQVARLGLVADDGQVYVANGVLQLGASDTAQASGALLAVTASLSDFMERMTRALEMVGNAHGNVLAANGMLREWYPFDDIGSDGGTDNGSF